MQMNDIIKKNLEISIYCDSYYIINKLLLLKHNIDYLTDLRFYPLKL